MNTALLKPRTSRQACHPARYRSGLMGTPVRLVPVMREEVMITAGAVLANAASTGAGTVRIIIKGRKLEVTEAIRNYVEKKLSHAMNHYSQSIRKAEVTLSVRGGDTGTKGIKQQKVEVTVSTLRNGVVRSEVTEESLYASIDLVCDKVERKLQKVKELAMRKGKWPGSGAHKGAGKLGEFQEMEEGPEASLDSYDEIDWEPQIVRTKSFALEAITPVEAAMTLENLGHDFYVFRDKDTRQVQVLYKRKERGYGLIIPSEDEEVAPSV